MTVCPSCGEENPGRAKFCLECAAPLQPRSTPALAEERKVVSILFCDLVGFTSRAEQLDPEDVIAVLQPYHERLRSELERFGGTVEKFIGDAVMAVFGVPAVHEDDAERAVRAALAIRDWAAEQADLQVRIAVNSGEALVNLDAHPEHGETMIAGDVVNTAARMQAAAPINGILVGEQTYRPTRDAIEYREAAPVEAKGKTQPVPVWEAVQPRARVEVEGVAKTPLVGRGRELDVLIGLLERVREDREPQLVTLVGVPGIGKSRLVFELFRHVEEHPTIHLWRQGRSLSYGAGISFWALAEIVKAQAGILESDASNEAAAKLGRAAAGAGDDAAWVESYLRPLVGLGEHGGIGQDRRLEAFAAWRRFLEGLADERPLILVFEDLHWADDGLLDFVDELCDWVTNVPLLVVATTRPELLERRPDWGGGKLNATTLSLTPLSDDESARLLHALIDRAVLPAQAQQAVLEHAGGNPLYAEQYARMVLERGSIKELPLPDTVHGIVAARLDALPAPEKSAVQSAAVVGRVFWTGALAAVAGDGPSLEPLLHALERKEFVRRERRSSVGRETQYAFRHVLVREAAYGQIPRSRRAEKHRRTAEWIESLAPDRSEDRAEMLAHHYLSALDYARAAGGDLGDLPKRAKAAAQEAGDRALALNAFAAASRLYSRALDLGDEEDPGRPQLLLLYGKALFSSEAAGADILAEARDALREAGDVETALEAECLVAWATWTQGGLAEAIASLEQLAAELDESRRSRATAHLLTMLSRFYMLAGQNQRAIDVGRRALGVAHELGLVELVADNLNNIGSARAGSGDDGGFADLERSIALAEELNLADGIPRGYQNLACSLADAGRLKESLKMHEQARDAALRFGNAWRLQWIGAELVHEWYACGRWREAERSATDLMSSEEHVQEAWCYAVRAQIRLARGDPRGAAADSTKAVEISRKGGVEQRAQALASRARVLVEEGRTQEARELARTVVEIHGEVGFRGTLSFGDLSFVLGSLGDDLGLREVDNPWVRAALAAAARDFRRAADVFAEIGSRPDEAYARLLAAEAGDRTQLKPALAFFREVEATAYSRRAERLLAATA
jgi:class 3 adenylate cyclase/tetratricopeptide (TPR) repeat protein